LATTGVTDMSGLFTQAASFNEDIGHWDTSNVTDMNDMFRAATSFNQDIGNWTTSSADSMSKMFKRATVFNQDIGNWDTSNVTDMTAMFSSQDGFVTAFSQDLTGWCVNLILTLPTDFAFGSVLTLANQPKWGEVCE
jgi:surface protein